MNGSRVYKIAKPNETHTRPGTCTEVACTTQAAGFIVNVDEATNLGQRQAFYIRQHSGRPHTESHLAGLTSFTFPAGAECFEGHRVDLDRPEFYAVQDLGQVKQHSGPDPWLNDCGTHLDKIRKQIG